MEHPGGLRDSGPGNTHSNRPGPDGPRDWQNGHQVVLIDSGCLGNDCPGRRYGTRHDLGTDVTRLQTQTTDRHRDWIRTHGQTCHDPETIGCHLDATNRTA
ncbi:hypothetical protein NP493_615g00008 [Ridgeia piscesae]|uniref:Uncharacterized protein n=1 Tax=Ridgeia piscesae TaxID=27915 RepID=A0AAD9KUJ2_RIDPI|nr:hypothetical protein NP493_615g00008 [Ridgeia piscesae]